MQPYALATLPGQGRCDPRADTSRGGAARPELAGSRFRRRYFRRRQLRRRQPGWGPTIQRASGPAAAGHHTPGVRAPAAARLCSGGQRLWRASGGGAACRGGGGARADAQKLHPPGAGLQHGAAGEAAHLGGGADAARNTSATEWCLLQARTEMQAPVLCSLAVGAPVAGPARLALLAPASPPLFLWSAGAGTSLCAAAARQHAARHAEPAHAAAQPADPGHQAAVE